jgi:hypothetical protein
MNRFAQILYGKVLYILDTPMTMGELSTIFNPKTYWVDVTNVECSVGDFVSFDSEKGFVFTKEEPVDTAEEPNIYDRVSALEEFVNAQLEMEMTDTNG